MSSLEEQDVEKLRQLLRSSAWNDVMKAAILGQVHTYRLMLELEPSERGDKPMSDETLRGVIKGLKWVLTRFEQEVQVYDSNRLREEQLVASSPNGQG